jgi:hypothetical protein
MITLADCQTQDDVLAGALDAEELARVKRDEDALRESSSFYYFQYMLMMRDLGLTKTPYGWE